MLGIIKRNFIHISRNCFIILYKSLVRSHLEYANNVWYPKRKTDVDKLERVQKRATKLIPGLSNKSYIKRLKVLNLPTLKYRRHQSINIRLLKNGRTHAQTTWNTIIPRYRERYTVKLLLEAPGFY